MIKRFNIFVNENYKTGIFNYNNMTFLLNVQYKNGLTDIEIIYKEHIYEHLSVNIPHSKNLGVDEFFINPLIDEDMVNILEDEGFIECTNIESISGDKKTISYKLV